MAHDDAPAVSSGGGSRAADWEGEPVAAVVVLLSGACFGSQMNVTDATELLHGLGAGLGCDGNFGEDAREEEREGD
jgi:hypothetical protein